VPPRCITKPTRKIHASDLPHAVTFSIIGADKTPDQCALLCVCAKTGNGQRYSFRELSQASRRAPGFFVLPASSGANRVLVMLPRVPWWWVSLLGLIRLGAVPVPATLQLNRARRRVPSAGREVSAVITSVEGVGKADGFDGIRILAGGSSRGWLDLDRALEMASDEFSAEPSASHDPGMIYLPAPRRVSPKWCSTPRPATGWAHHVTGSLWLDLKPGDVHWNLSDLGWAKAPGRVSSGPGIAAPAFSRWIPAEI